MEFRIVGAGDAALVVELPSRIDPDISDAALAVAAAVRRRCAASVLDVVVGYCTVTVYFDPLRVDPEALEGEIREIAGTASREKLSARPLLDVPVCYGGDEGPDLGSVAAAAGVTEEEAVAIHCATTDRVYVVGFMPGFAYMAPVDPRLALPRRASPRTRVPAGSVAIAAGQTGIYPLETPGGWHLIGRTPLKPYDPARAEPFSFSPGDRVRFCPIDRRTFTRDSPWA